jgi:predicted amidohydrolase
MDCVLENKNLNIEHAVQFINEIKPGTDIVCLPEFFSTGYNLDLIGDGYYRLAETIPGNTTEQLGIIARQKRVTIIGNIVEKDKLQESVLYDTAFVIDEQGEIRGKYRKYNLYPTEHRFFRSGDSVSALDLGSLKVGLAICFDHAFPELFRLLALQGAQIIFIPSAVPKGFDYLLNLRTRARAQDNQVFVAAINRVGREGDVEYCGLSKIVNPKGEVIAEASGDSEEVLYADIDLNMIAEERKREPVLRALRLDLLEKACIFVEKDKRVL